MKNLLKYMAGTLAVMFFLTSCDDNAIVKQDTAASDASGSSAVIPLLGFGSRPEKHCGCPGGSDAVDSDGNVIVNRNVSFSNDTIYVIHNFFRVQNGRTLTIEAGTQIAGAKVGDAGCATAPTNPKPGAVVIERGAKIDAQGTAASPIIFSSNARTAASRLPGDWAGVVLLGKADVCLAAGRGAFPSGVDGLGFIEGLQVPNNLGRYGNGDNPGLTPGTTSYNTDNSGIMTYVRIEYAGYIIGEANELNGLTLGGVGCGTTLDHIQVSYGADDAFEFFGGTVSAKYLVAYNTGDDDFDTDQGFTGKLQYGVSVRSQNGNWLSSAPLNGSETNGDDDDDYSGCAVTDAELSNFTFIGPFQNSCSGTVNTNYDAGVYFRDDTHQDLFNSVIAGFPKGVRLTDGATTEFNTAASLNASLIDIRNTTIAVPMPATGFTMAATWDNVTGAAWNATFTSVGSNAIFTAGECTEVISTPARTMATHLGLSTAAWNGASGSMPNLNPISGSPLLNAADFTLLDTTNDGCVNDYFEINTYRGAFGQSGNWMATWTAW